MAELIEDGVEEIVQTVILCVSGVIGDEEEGFCLVGVMYIVAGPSDGDSIRRRPLTSFGSVRDLTASVLSMIVLDGGVEV